MRGPAGLTTIARITASREQFRLVEAGDPYPDLPYETDNEQDEYWREIEQHQAANPWLY